MKRRGFTLIEMLVVVGIILILLGIAVMGYRHLDKAAAEKQTRTTLGMCRSLLVEYTNQNAFKFIEGPPPLPNTQLLTVYVDPPTGTVPKGTAQAPQEVLLTDFQGDMSDGGSNTKPRYKCNAVLRTRKVMKYLIRIPANRTIVTNLPTKRLLEPAPNQPPIPLDESTGAPVSGAVVLDGWGNPVIYVPAAGMHVYIQGSTSSSNVNAAGAEYVVRSTGTFPFSDIGKHPLTDSDRPFFASAGQDGDFTRGDDNLYSFQGD